MEKKWLAVLVTFVVLSLLVPSLASAEEPKYGGTLRWGLHVELGKIDPHKQTTCVEGQVGMLITNSLIESGRDYEQKPALAESWEVSADGKTWTYHLRKGVKFHNGREMTAADVKWNLERMLDPKTGGGMRARLTDIVSIETPDDYTVVLTLKEVSARFESAFSCSCIQAPIIAPECVGEDGNVSHPIGTGPFEFVEWVPLDHYTVKRFADYWDKGLPYLDEIIVTEVVDDTTRLTALRTGELDFAQSFSLSDAANLVKNPVEGVEIVFSGDWGYHWVHFNCSQPPFNDVRVRQAVAHAIDREEILLGASFGQGVVTNQCYPPDSRWFCDVPSLPKDIEKAKALLKEAGYPDGLEVKLAVTSSYPSFHQMAEIVHTQLKAIGMNVKLDVTDWPTYIQRVFSGEYQLGVCSDGGRPADPGHEYIDFITSAGAYTWFTGKYENPQLTSLLTQADRVMDFDKRKALYTEAMTIFINEAPMFFTHGQNFSYGWRSYVKGYVPHIAFLMRYADGGMHHVWLEK